MFDFFSFFFISVISFTEMLRISSIDRNRSCLRQLTTQLPLEVCCYGIIFVFMLIVTFALHSLVYS